MAELRPVSDRDTAELVALIQAAYDEYPGCVLDLPGVDDDLLEPATTAARRGGRWWVLEEADSVVASVGTGALDSDDTMELKRLYVAPSHRRRGIARRLVSHVEAHATGIGATTVELWSDTRFGGAHQLYEELGYVRTGATRQLHDPSDTTEYHFARAVAPASPRIDVTWHGPYGIDTCHLVELPDGIVLRGEVGSVAYQAEVDAAWRSRVVRVSEPSGTRRLTSDGEGRWWRDGTLVQELDGCLDIDIEVTPATNALPIRRAASAVGDTVDVVAAWVRVPGPDVVPSSQHYTRIAADRWVYRSGGVRAEITVDDVGLPTSYGDLWQRR